MSGRTTTTATAGQRLFTDDFRGGLRTAGDDAPWQVRPAAGLPAGDGAARAVPWGLLVEPLGTDPTTGEPAFVAGEPGHVRWAALAAATSSRGFPGFDVPEGSNLSLTAELGVQTFGPASAEGLAGPHAAMITVDRETGLVFDVMLTARHVYAVYERLPNPGGAGTFSYAVPVAERSPDDLHRCAVNLDATGAVRWVVDGQAVLTVSTPGLRCLPAEYLTRGDDVPEQAVVPRQLTLGLGLFAGSSALTGGARLQVREVRVTRAD